MTDALLELVLAEWGPGAMLCWGADGTLAAMTQGFHDLFGLVDCADAEVERIWSRIRGRCASDPGDLASAFAGADDFDLVILAEGAPRSIRLALRRLARPMPLTALLARDVTDLQRRERDLRAQSDLLEGIFRRLPVALAVVDEDRRVLRVSDALEDLVGDGLDEILGESTRQLHVDDASDERAEALLEAPVGHQLLMQARRKTGEVLDVKVTLSALDDGPGDARLHIAAAEDVTERLRLDRELRRFRDMVAVSRDAIALIDPELRFLVVNPAYSKLWGLSSDALVGRKVEEIVGAERFEAKLKDRLLSCLRGEFEVLPVVEEIDGFPDRPRCLEVTYTPQRDADGVVAGVLANLRDVTERALAEAAVRRSERHLASVFRAAPIGIGVVKERVFQRVNPKFCDLLGYREEALIGRSARLLYVDDAEFERVGREKYAMLAERGVGEAETRFCRRDGGAVDVLLRSAWLDQSRPEAGATFTVLDISERKRQERALRESEQRARALLEAMPDLMFRLDREAVYLDYKAAREDLAAQHVESLIGLSVRELAPAPFADLIEAKIAETLSTGELQAFEFGLEIPGRGVRDWEARMVPSGADEVIATVRDLTAQKADAARLHMLSRVVEQSADAVLLTDIDFRINYVNPAFEALFGWTLDELRGRSPDMLNAELDAGAHQQEIYARLAAGEQVAAEVLNRRKDGSLFHCRYWVSPLHDEQGAVVGYMGSQRDVSTRVQAQQKLAASEARYRMLAEHSSDLIAKHRLDGRFLYVSPSCHTLLGYEPEELLGRSPYDFFHEDDLDAVRTSHDTVLSSQSVYRVQYRMRRKDGSWIWLETNSHRVAHADSPPGFVILSQSRDITEALQLRQAMAQSQKMEAIGRLTAGIAHDFNNILGSILGFAELSRLHNAGADAKLEGYLEQIDIAGGRARDLVRQLLVFSRGDSTLGAQPMPLEPMVKEVLKMLRPALPPDVRVRLEGVSEGLIVEIDPLHVQQMLLNLVLNARDAMPKGGEIRLILGKTEADDTCAICRERVSGDWVELSVADSGCGIPKEHLDLLFQPFFTTKEVGEGSGMGLSVIAGLMRTYEGHILVSSRPGEGSRFRLLLPPAKLRGSGES
ncbi:PAS domain-containing sensor histidine kinase [Thiorhodococcus minor]|uniref:histidine kinase n=1 Tax=Thiorhodococcus minor TaxID=57489 RepID=A0A6M0K0V4_9GAMM|nr:PAS domain S-box protein [Thiorhodococcus minor]NEV63398.1 PAS domain S-box protein [Thiorhodococcus minor]